MGKWGRFILLTISLGVLMGGRLVFADESRNSLDSATFTCRADLAKYWKNKKRIIEKEYQEKAGPLQLDPAHMPSLKTHKREKRNEAVYLLHGFMGSPAEMQAMAQKFYQEGFDVYLDLIPGFGATPYLANQYSRGTWTQSVTSSIDAMEACYKKIHLVGFSTGGLLVYQYLLQHPFAFKKFKAVLLSPFFEPHDSFLKLTGLLLGDVQFKISVRTLYQWTHHPDLVVLLKAPEMYLQAAPLAAANQVFELGQEVIQEKEERSHSLRVPVLMFLSEGDRVLKLEKSLEMAKVFLQKEVRIFKDKSPHHLFSYVVSDKAKMVEDRVLDFIKE